MKNYLTAGILLAPLATAAAFAQSGDEDFYQQWVNIKDGEVSVAFNQTPVQFALDAFHAKTGFNIVVPASTESKTVNLRLHRQPFEPAIRSLISTIGYDNFAMVYDQKGRPHSAVVLGARVPAVIEASNTAAPTTPLTIEERDRLKKEIDRWNELKQEERGRIEDRLRNVPPSEDREILVREYGRQLLGTTK
jgi:type II secretory pathway component GspD/PulD (secretin)